ncbi:hypothetical protein AK95_25690 [Paenibacillus sp. LC231]|uniref:Uncharacterized protein n=1 Tax=Paenibacillus lautus TaxID=1401 RepID=A0A385U0B3_PAELA|nr:hypothetical protein B9D94_00090 [Paenibacillus sp. Cedars]AYB48152.1 hypothetical protein D5F53_33090 [Paenibacillus lautus]OIB00571.1 hypothetical protein AK95_25690 [Paenibacillus sp. LC231]VTR35778.1 Uncharacterised protein [Actinobacillus pleuropneumoniae]
MNNDTFLSLLKPRIMILSSLLLFTMISIVFLTDIYFIDFNNTVHLIAYYICPFVIHLLLSLFVKNKVSWLLGATLTTIISLVLILVVVLVFF